MELRRLIEIALIFTSPLISAWDSPLENNLNNVTFKPSIPSCAFWISDFL